MFYSLSTDKKKWGIEAGYIRGQLETIWGRGREWDKTHDQSLKWTHYFLDFEK
jgi:hypothetical protein